MAGRYTSYELQLLAKLEQVEAEADRLRARVAELEAMEQRAQIVRDEALEQSERDTARYILGEA